MPSGISIQPEIPNNVVPSSPTNASLPLLTHQRAAPILKAECEQGAQAEAASTSRRGPRLIKAAPVKIDWRVVLLARFGR